MLWEQSVVMNREKGRPYLGEAALFLRKNGIRKEFERFRRKLKWRLERKKLSGIYAGKSDKRIVDVFSADRMYPDFADLL